jgi:hypothetical protein
MQGHYLLYIFPYRPFFPRITQERGRMECGHNHTIAYFMPVSPLPGYGKIRVNQGFAGNSPQANDNAGINQFHLFLQKGETSFNLVPLGLAVTGWAAFDDIGDINFVSLPPGSSKNAIKKLARRTYKRTALPVFLCSRPLTDKHYFRLGITLTENHTAGPPAQKAPLALEA